MKFTIEEIIRATEAEVIKNKLGKAIETVISTDTRTIQQGDMYLPLKGESFDGEQFIEKALKNGAIGSFVTKAQNTVNCSLVLKVSDTKEAYLKLANFARKKYNPKTIAITGSSGKTTTKEMVYSVCNYKFKTQKTFSNHNNEIGFCQTVLNMPEDCEVLIIEMGMRGLGEIKLLSKYSEPDYAIITNVGSAHIGRLGSLDNIAKAKSEIIVGLNKNGTLVANNSDRLKNFINFSGEKIYYSIKDVKILNKKAGYSKFEYKNNVYELNVEGDYNIENALSAIEIGYKLNMNYTEIKNGLLSYKPIEKRWETQEVNGFHIINDSYNANPDSMKASVSTFIELYKKPVVVLGNMGELGEHEIELHKEVGIYLTSITKDKNVKFLTVGNLADEITKELVKQGFLSKNFKNNDEISRYIVENTSKNTTIFLKASRSMKFEQIIDNIKGENK